MYSKPLAILFVAFFIVACNSPENSGREEQPNLVAPQDSSPAKPVDTVVTLPKKQPFGQAEIFDFLSNATGTWADKESLENMQRDRKYAPNIIYVRYWLDGGVIDPVSPEVDMDRAVSKRWVEPWGYQMKLEKGSYNGSWGDSSFVRISRDSMITITSFEKGEKGKTVLIPYWEEEKIMEGNYTVKEAETGETFEAVFGANNKLNFQKFISYNIATDFKSDLLILSKYPTDWGGEVYSQKKHTELYIQEPIDKGFELYKLANVEDCYEEDLLAVSLMDGMEEFVCKAKKGDLAYSMTKK